MWINVATNGLSTGRGFVFIYESKSRGARRDRQTAEMEEIQKGLRTSISTSKRLADEADEMIQRQRHRRECDQSDRGK